MAALTVYRASAGSGKTYRLTVEYLKLLVKDPSNYARILAVTFTNKATNEMKERIVCELYGLTRSYNRSILKLLQQETGFDESHIVQAARQALFFILHDYSHFKIETIDRFFQSVLRNMAKELGIGAYLNIVLHYDDLLEEAVKRMIDATKEDVCLLEWVGNYIEEKIDEGNSWHISRELNNFGRSIFLEVFQEKATKLEEKLTDKRFLNDYRRKLYDLRQAAMTELQERGVTFLRMIEEKGLEVDQFSYGASGVAGYFLKLSNGQFDDKLCGKRVADAMESAALWSKKRQPYTTSIEMLAADLFIPYLKETEEMRKKNSSIIQSCNLSLQYLNRIGLLSDISKEINEINKNNNSFLLAETSALLHRMVSEKDTSFIYEKIGSHLRHIMIDEFQDTSSMQWGNFLPLLVEGLSQGYESLIVGDEKQAIYRWRNGDWRILNHIDCEPCLGEVDTRILDTNWRSEQVIVDFNNRLFPEMVGLLNGIYKNKFGNDCEELIRAYSSIQQKCAKSNCNGLVEVSFLQGDTTDEYHELVLSSLVERVEALQLSGICASDIAILVRENKYIPRIAAYFNRYSLEQGVEGVCYTVVSDEAFQLKASDAVNILIDALYCLNDSQIDLYGMQLAFLWQKKKNGGREPKQTFFHSNDWQARLPVMFIQQIDTLRSMPLYELLETLYRLFDLHTLPSQESYIYTFFDKVAEFLQNNVSDLTAFLLHWENVLAGTTVTVGDEVDGIRILSIHKSKGLEYHTVLLPYCDWPLETNHRDLLVWCTPGLPPFNDLDLLPINYGKNMQRSIYSEAYRQELYQLWTDNLNILYVALTRARANLIVWGRDKVKKEYQEEHIATVSDLMKVALQTSSLLNCCYDADKQFFSTGSLYLSLSENDKEPDENLLKRKSSSVIVPFASFKARMRFRQSNQSKLYIAEGAEALSPDRLMDRGKLFHALFATIGTIDQCESAIDAFIMNGLIAVEERAAYIDYLKEAFDNPIVQDWYSGRYRLFNECTILFKDPTDSTVQNRRPDRVMLSGNEMIVVDFKFGQPHPKYVYQVREYIQLLVKMGYDRVKGFLWYVDRKTIEPVLCDD